MLPKDPQGGSLLVLPAYWDYQVRVDIGGKKGESIPPSDRLYLEEVVRKAKFRTRTATSRQELTVSR